MCPRMGDVVLRSKLGHGSVKLEIFLVLGSLMEMLCVLYRGMGTGTGIGNGNGRTLRYDRKDCRASSQMQSSKTWDFRSSSSLVLIPKAW
jgi:hypothetical protein